jgi:regulator of nonsense transcripts 2
MMRKRQQLAGFDQRYQMMIDNAFFTCDPPPAPTVQRAERPPMHEYIRRQLFRDLGKSTSDRVLRQMRKIDWSDENVSGMIFEHLLENMQHVIIL